MRNQYYWGAGMAVLDGTLEPARLHAFAGAVRAALAISEAAQFDLRLRELELAMRKIGGEHGSRG